jgi:hypothetical protein
MCAYLVGVVSNHDLNALVKLPTCQQLARQGRQEITINGRSVGKAAVRGQTDSDCVGELESFGRELACLFDARYVQPLEVVEEDLLLLGAGRHGCEARRLRDCLHRKSVQEIQRHQEKEQNQLTWLKGAGPLLPPYAVI